jgi:hypothetical protein
MRPMLSPAPAALNRDAFISDGYAETTVDLQAHRATSDLDELALDDEQTTQPVWLRALTASPSFR